MSLFGANNRVLMVGGEGVVLYAPVGRGVERETSIAWDVPNFEQVLSDALAEQHQTKSVLVLFDGADQTYKREENIPKMSFIDQPRFVKRKLELAYPSYPIRAALEIKLAKHIKKIKTTPSYLFVALPETEQLDRIGQALYESGVPVAGFGLLPLESSGLVTELSKHAFGDGAKKSRWSVLIGQHETGGLRQVVVKDGNLALTRLTPTSEAGSSGPGWVEEATREFRATLTYISRFGYSAEDGLDVIVVCGDIEKQFFDVKAMPTPKFLCLNPAEALRHIGVRAKNLEKTNYADSLHAAWAGHKARLKLPVVVPSIQRVMAPRQRTRLGSIALAILACGIAATTVSAYYDYTALQTEISEKQNQRTMLAREYEQESKIFDELPIRPDALKAALGVKTLLETNTASLHPLLHKLKAVLGNDVQLDDMRYEHTTGTGLDLLGASGGIFASAPNPADRGRVKVSFKFGLPDAMALEQKVTKAEQIAEALRAAFPGYSVSIVSQFGKVDRTGKFTGGVGAGGSSDIPGDLAEFSLEGAPL